MGNSLEFQREEVSSNSDGFLIYDSYSSRFIIHRTDKHFSDLWSKFIECN
jgi:hypothetical protein